MREVPKNDHFREKTCKKTAQKKVRKMTPPFEKTPLPILGPKVNVFEADFDPKKGPQKKQFSGVLFSFLSFFYAFFDHFFAFFDHFRPPQERL